MSVNEDAKDVAADCCQASGSPEGGDASGGSGCCAGGSAGGGSGGGKVWKTIIFVVVILAAAAVAGHSILTQNGKTACSLDKAEASCDAAGISKGCCPFEGAAATDCNMDKASAGCDSKQSLPCSK